MQIPEIREQFGLPKCLSGRIHLLMQEMQEHVFDSWMRKYPGKEMANHSTVLVWRILLTEEPQFSSVTQSCLTLCDPMDCSTSGFPVHHQPLEFTQTHVH